ncbi:hypothetical protein FRC08_001452 [Ceratobasidium sp. 394]|nr:hypothetical protein FRC08_001452 [Ceratobasidium sp. 394]KAG9091651.1 hypothetical protein FS749_016373 [Ceratobasidium sp. UAMH 11750]
MPLLAKRVGLAPTTVSTSKSLQPVSTSQQQKKRKAVAEARGNALQPEPVAKRQKTSNLLGHSYDEMATEKDRVEWLLQALAQRGDARNYRASPWVLTTRHLEAIWYSQSDPVDDRDEEEEEDQNEDTVIVKPESQITRGIRPGEASVMHRGDHRGATFTSTKGVVTSSGNAATRSLLPHRPDKALSVPAPNNTQSVPVWKGPQKTTEASNRSPSPTLSKSKSSRQPARPPPTAGTTKPQKGAIFSRQAFLAMRKKAGKSGPIQPKQQTSPKRKIRPSGLEARQPRAAAPPTVARQARAVASPDAEEDPPRSDDIPHGEQGARPDQMNRSSSEASEPPPQPNPASRAKRQAAQLRKFGIARPLVQWVVEQVRLRMLITCGYPDFTPATTQPSRATAALPTYNTLLEQWIGELWPKANKQLWRNRAPQVLEDRFVRYILDKPTQLRNWIKQVAEKKITPTYRVRLGHPRTKAKVKDLLLESKFLSPNLAADEYRFQHDIIGNTIQDTFFHGPKCLGYKYRKQIAAAPEAPIAFASTIIRHMLKSFKYTDGRANTLDREEDSQIFEYYLAEMNRLARDNENRLKNHWAKVITGALQSLACSTTIPTPQMEWGEDEDPDEERIAALNDLLGSDQEDEFDQDDESGVASDND